LAIAAELPSTPVVPLEIVHDLAMATDAYNATVSCPDFLEHSWCNCHDGLLLRMGVAEGMAIIYTDINGQPNVAGRPINEAARLLGIADPRQALLTESVVRNLLDLSSTPSIKSHFRSHGVVDVKHDVRLTVYQYCPEDSTLDCAVPAKLRKDSTASHDASVSRLAVDFINAAITLVEQFGVQQSVEVISRDNKWVFSLLPSITSCRLAGCLLRVITAPTDDPKVRQRIGLLARMGCEVRYLPQWTDEVREMFLFDSALDYSRQAMLMLSQQSTTPHVFASFYERNTDSTAVLLFREHFYKQWDRSEPVRAETAGVSLSRGDPSDLVQRIKNGVVQYRAPHVRVEMTTVKLDGLEFLARRLFRFKYKQIPRVLELYETIGAGLFEPLRINLGEDRFSIMTPPVVEERSGGRLVILNGSHRSYFLRNQGAEAMMCVVVRGVTEPLPGTPVDYREVVLDERMPPEGTRVRDFDYARFRHVESAVHPPSEVWL
jgi:hypothetical protein